MINKFLKLFIVAALLTGVISCGDKEGNKMSVLQKKPVFELKISGFGSRYFIELNGVIVFRQYNAEGQISTRIPINHYMKNGDNLLAISAWSGDGTPINLNANIRVDMLVSAHESPGIRHLVTSINYQNGLAAQQGFVTDSSKSGLFDSKQGFVVDESGDVQVFDIVEETTVESFDCKRKLNIPSSIPLWALFSSDELPEFIPMSDEDYYEYMDTLLPYYMKVQKAIENNDIESVIPMFAERNKELDAAFYYPPGTMENLIRDSLADAAGDENAQLVELTNQKVNFVAHNDNTLVSLSRSLAEAAIGLDYKNGMGSYGFDLIFRRKDGEWILTR